MVRRQKLLLFVASLICLLVSAAPAVGARKATIGELAGIARGLNIPARCAAAAVSTVNPEYAVGDFKFPLSIACSRKVFNVGVGLVRRRGAHWNVLFSASCCYHCSQVPAPTAVKRGVKIPGCVSRDAVRSLAAASYSQCSTNPRNPAYLLTVMGLRRVTVAVACNEWKAVLKAGRPTKCLGKIFTRSARPVLLRHFFHGWTLSLVHYQGYQAIKISRGRQSFIAGGQDAPPYPC